MKEWNEQILAAVKVHEPFLHVEIRHFYSAGYVARWAQQGRLGVVTAITHEPISSSSPAFT